MTTYVTTFRSTDTGAPTLSGTAGDLINVLSHCLIIGKVFSTTNDSTFTDNTSEARSSAGTAFTLFPTPATADRTYFGHSVPFYNLTFSFGTAGSAATYVWEYWNGSAWTSLTVTDGTSSFTVNGSVSWTAGAASGWATTSVNSVTMYYVRVRFTWTAPTTNPLVNSVSYLGWLEVQSGTNQRDYKQGPGSNSMIASINDNGPGAGTGKEARMKGFETSTGLGAGTNQFPTTGLITGGFYVIRKSTSLDAVTRGWIIVADQRTWYLFILTGDTAGVYSGSMFGEFYSLVTPTSDPGRVIICGRTAENNATMTLSTETLSVVGVAPVAGNTMVTPRDWQGTQVASLVSKMGDYYLGAFTGATGNGNIGQLAFPNPADSKIYVVPMWIYNTTVGVLFRGRMRGFYQWGHAAASVADGDTFTGTTDLAGKSFLIIKSGPISDLYVLETSDTWETN